MNSKTIEKIGIPNIGNIIPKAQKLCAKAANNNYSKQDMKDELGKVAKNPEDNIHAPVFGPVAVKMVEWENSDPREDPKPFKTWGGDGIDPNAKQQLIDATKLPVAKKAALMPDAHLGYGLPIGGVLATKNAIIPNAVGVDIACRMKCTITDIPANKIDEDKDELIDCIEKHTRFGMGSCFEKGNKNEHPILDKPDWNKTKQTRKLKDKAYSQLGSSGGGNHFVEFGIVEIENEDNETGLKPGKYLAIMSHSGSRGPGARLAEYYTNMAKEMHPELQREEIPKSLQNLAWLDMDSSEGQEYWWAMNFMAEYAEAHHETIHSNILSELKADSLFVVENHHNLAWREEHDGEEFIVHRKGATPAGKGEMGIIPGTMVDPAFIVVGKGNKDSLKSASHGAGRKMSRGGARRNLDKDQLQKKLNDNGVTLISAGLDESPDAYKDIESVMAQQNDLVGAVAKFHPKIVKMAPDEVPPWRK